MYNIALICEHGASTGLCVRKMREAAKNEGIECTIDAYSALQLDSIVGTMDCILIGPQLSYKLDNFKQTYPEYAKKMAVINSMDFGMMNGSKILKDAIDLIESTK
jgi:Phosphotransferase system cellobiose-specific component IIB